jgi:hypothetical protein
MVSNKAHFEFFNLTNEEGSADIGWVETDVWVKMSINTLKNKENSEVNKYT